MQAFVPIEDALADTLPRGVLRLVPYQIGMLCEGWRDVVVEPAESDSAGAELGVHRLDAEAVTQAD